MIVVSPTKASSVKKVFAIKFFLIKSIIFARDYHYRRRTFKQIMIQRLSIKNYAIIEQLELDFSDGLTIITGETGAGKSILLGALGLIMGKRADTRTLYIEDQKCVIEGSFDVAKYELEDFFARHDLDTDQESYDLRAVDMDGDGDLDLLNAGRASRNVVWYENKRLNGAAQKQE